MRAVRMMKDLRKMYLVRVFVDVGEVAVAAVMFLSAFIVFVLVYPVTRIISRRRR